MLINTMLILWNL